MVRWQTLSSAWNQRRCVLCTAHGDRLGSCHVILGGDQAAIFASRRTVDRPVSFFALLLDTAMSRNVHPRDGMWLA